MKIFVIFLILMLLSVAAFAAQESRPAGYPGMVASYDVIGQVAATPNGYLPKRLSENSSDECGLIRLCSDTPNAKIYYGNSAVNAVLKKGAPLNPSTGSSCDTVYVDNVNDIYVSKDAAAVTPTVSWVCYK